MYTLQSYLYSTLRQHSRVYVPIIYTNLPFSTHTVAVLGVYLSTLLYGSAVYVEYLPGALCVCSAPSAGTIPSGYWYQVSIPGIPMICILVIFLLNSYPRYSLCSPCLRRVLSLLRFPPTMSLSLDRTANVLFRNSLRWNISVNGLPTFTTDLTTLHIRKAIIRV